MTSEYQSSYIFYLATIALSASFTWLGYCFRSQSSTKLKLNPLFLSLSFLTLWFAMGFRFEIGVDYFNYQRMFEEVAHSGFIGYYRAGFWTEPGYIFLLYLVNLTIGDFTGVFAVTSFIGLLLFYKAFARESSFAHPALSVFIFATTIYFYFWGIDRLFLAVALSYYSLQYIFEGKTKKYYFAVLLASLFHVSALVMLSIPTFMTLTKSANHAAKGVVIKPQLQQRTNVRTHHLRFILLMFSLPFLFYGLTLITPYLPAKYQNYGTEGSFFSNIFSIVLKLPIVFALYFAQTTVCRRHDRYAFYANLYYSSVFIQAFSGLAGVGRLGWFFWPSLCIALPMAIKGIKHNNYLRLCYILFTFVYCIGYLMYAYLGPDTGRWDVMFPYRNIFFEL